MSKKAIKIYNPQNLPTVDFHELKPMQGDLKILPEVNCLKLYNSLKKYGYRVPAFVWKDEEGTLWIEDFHQRQKVLVKLEEHDYLIPPIPYVEIYAKDKKEAAEMLLQITSRYGVINAETTFFDEFDLPIVIIEEIEIPELNFLLPPPDTDELYEGMPEFHSEGIMNDAITCIVRFETEEAIADFEKLLNTKLTHKGKTYSTWFPPKDFNQLGHGLVFADES